jgi:hypothetical protein
MFYQKWKAIAIFFQTIQTLAQAVTGGLGAGEYLTMT